MAGFDGYIAPQLVVEVAWVSNPLDANAPSGFILDISQFDVGQLGATTLWTDLGVTDDLVSIKTRIGRDNREDQISPGAFSVELDNHEGQYDSLNPAGPFYVGNQIHPMRQIRIRAVWNEVSYDIIRGTIQNFSYNYGTDPTVTLECVDALAILGVQQIDAINPQLYGDEYTGARITRILDIAAWDASLRAIDVGGTKMAATKWGESALSAIQVATTAEAGGIFYCAPNGKMTFLDRFSQWVDATSNVVQMTFDDSDDTQPNYTELAIEYGIDQVTNSYRVTRLDFADPAVAVQQSADDTASIDLHAKRSEEFSDVSVMTDGVALDWGMFKLGQNKDPQIRVQAVTVDALCQPAFWAQTLSLGLHHRIKIVRNYTPAYEFIREVLIESISHTISNDKWTISFTTSDPSVGQAFTFDISKLGSTDKLVF